jgi:universal stress protein A
MLPLRKILCPTDFSEPSYQALAVASELAAHFQAELVVVHTVTSVPVVPTPHAGAAAATFDVQDYQAGLRQSAEQGLRDLLREKVPAEVRVRSLVLQGDAAREVVEAAADQGADLVVIATHGRTGWRRLVFGSVAEKVVRFSECPVLTVRDPQAET